MGITRAFTVVRRSTQEWKAVSRAGFGLPGTGAAAAGPAAAAAAAAAPAAARSSALLAPREDPDRPFIARSSLVRTARSAAPHPAVSVTATVSAGLCEA